MMYEPTEDKRFVRDKRSKAILNIDQAGYEAFKQARDTTLKQQKLEQTVAKLEDDITDIKRMLQLLISGNGNGKSSI